MWNEAAWEGRAARAKCPHCPVALPRGSLYPPSELWAAPWGRAVPCWKLLSAPCPACCPVGCQMPRHQVKINIYWKIVTDSENTVEKNNSPYLELTCVAPAPGAGWQQGRRCPASRSLARSCCGQSGGDRAVGRPLLGLPTGASVGPEPGWGRWLAAVSRTCASGALVQGLNTHQRCEGQKMRQQRGSLQHRGAALAPHGTWRRRAAPGRPAAAPRRRRAGGWR